MSLTKIMQQQGGNPSGLLGRLIGKLMNRSHGSIHKWGLSKCEIKENDICLDVGCGGGSVLKEMAKLAAKGEIHGVDHSLEMVNLSKALNKGLIIDGLAKINQGSVTSLPYPEKHFDLVTAFETIQFWPDLDRSIQEIKRVLKPTGTFMVVNRYPPENSKWSDFLQIKNSKEYDMRLRSAHFDVIEIDDKSKKGWICVLAKIQN